MADATGTTAATAGISAAVALPTFPTLPVVPFDAHVRIERETPAMLPLAHGLGVRPFEQMAPAQGTQQAAADPGLDFGQRFWAQGVGFVKLPTARPIGIKHALDDDAKTKRQRSFSEGSCREAA